jgi:hypothetical protein
MTRTGAGNRPLSPDLPTIDLLYGDALVMDIAEPCWLYAGRLTELDSGLSWSFVYRSLALKETDPMYAPALPLTAGELIDSKTVADPHMMFGSAELALYTAPVELAR